MSKEFKRQDWMRFSRLGKNRRKLQKWRRPHGIHSKMRLKMAGYPSVPRVGYKTPKAESGRIQGLTPVLVHNLKEMLALDKRALAILARVGAKKKLHLIKEAEKRNIRILNVRGGAI